MSAFHPKRTLEILDQDQLAISPNPLPDLIRPLMDFEQPDASGADFSQADQVAAACKLIRPSY